ncbi:MAG: hypothetical protein SH818_14750 [Saprospiraceae bacterium]|nr:hypothetical protein [Saprospiraceae bacterium]
MHIFPTEKCRFNILFTREYRLVQRAAWPISFIIENHPGLIKKHLAAVTGALADKNLPDAVKRNLLRLLQNLIIPKKYCGKIADACFKFISNTEEKAAIKVFSISILEKISLSFPELKAELKLILETAYDHESPAFISRVRKILKSNLT